MNIAFWSNVAGKGATSGNMLAVGTMTSVLYSIRTVLVQTDRASKPIDEVFEGRRNDNAVAEEFQFYSRKGMDELIERARLDLLTTELVKTNMVNVRHTNLNYIPSAREECANDSSDAIRMYEQLLKQLNSMGDINFWDLANGEAASSMRIMEKSDVVVINVCQEPYGLKLPEAIASKAVYLVGRYDGGSRRGIGQLCREYNVSKGDIGVVPYNIHFHDALYEGRIVPFIMKNIFSKKQDANFEFINSLFRSTNLVLKKAGVEGIG